MQVYKEHRIFDVITFVNVLDHLAEPWQDIKKASGHLVPQGLVYLRFPNGLMHVLIFRIASKFKMGGFVSRHLVFHEYCFTPKYIRRLFKDCGFRRIDVVNSILSDGDPHKLFQNEFYIRSIKK